MTKNNEIITRVEEKTLLPSVEDIIEAELYLDRIERKLKEESRGKYDRKY